MSTGLNQTLAARQEWPYAVGVTMPGDTAPTFVHFSDKRAANLHAYVMDTEQNTVTRWVAILEPDVTGWRQVTKFYV